MPSITERHYAHICNEAYLAGAFELEGYDFRKTTAFLRDYVADHKDTIPREGELVYKALNDLSEFNTRINMPGKALDDLVASIYEKVMALKEGEFVLLPGGWHGDPGHAMIYELRKNEHGGLVFKIYNSGAGIEEHQRHLEKFDPVVSYEISATELAKIDFKTHFNLVVKQLMEVSKVAEASSYPTRVDTRVQTAKELYQDVIAKLAYLGGVRKLIEEAPSEEEQTTYTRGQLAGICAQTALHEMLKAHFATTEESIRFMYGFKAHTLECYIETLKSEGEFLNPAKKDLLIKGIKSNLRLLNRLARDGSYVFEDEYKRGELTRLSGYLAELRVVQKEKALSHAPSLTPVKAVPDMSYKYVAPPAPIPDALPKDDYARGRATAPTPITTTLISESSDDIISDLDKIYTEITQLQSLGRHEEAIKRLESLFFIQLKLPGSIDEPLKPPYTALNTNEKAQAFFKQITLLETLANSVYPQHWDKLGINVHTYWGGKITPAIVMQQHIRLSCMALNAHVFSSLPAYQRQPEQYKELQRKMFSCFPSREIMLSAYDMASNNPIVDARYEHLCTLFSPLGMKKMKTEEYGDVELTLLQKTIAQSPQLLDMGKRLFTLQQEKEVREYTAELEEYNTKLANWRADPRGPAPEEVSMRNPEAFHIFLKKQNLHTVYGFIQNIDMYQKNKCAAVFSSTIAPADRTVIEAELARFYKEVQSIQQYKVSFFGVDDGLWPYSYLSLKLNHPAKAYAAGKKRVHVNDRRYEQRSSDAKLDLLGVTELIGENNLDSMILLIRDDKIRRELMLLRTVPETQIPLTIDYFSRNLHHLTMPNMKLYMEANLFQPGLLREHLLTNNTPFFIQFDQFINDGLRLFRDRNSPNKESLFFVRMSFLVCQYAAKLDSTKHLGKLDVLYEKINSLITHCNDNTVKRALLKYRMMTANEIKTHAPERSSTFFNDDLEMLFSANLGQIYDEHIDSESKYQYALAKQKIVDSLEDKDDEQITAALREVAKRQGIDAAHCPVRCTYPVFTFDFAGEPLQFNVHTGMIYKGGFSRVVTPDDLKSHPLLIAFGLASEPYCYCSIGANPTRTVKKGPLEIQISKDRCLIRGLAGLNDGKWYEIFAIDKNEAKQLGIPKHNSFIPLSTTIADHGSFILTECGDFTMPADIALVKGSTVVVKGAYHNGSAVFIDDATGRTLCNHESSQLTQPFTAFESEEYIDVFYDEESATYQIELSRYGLTFDKKPDDPMLYCQYNGERYRLKPSVSTLIEQGIPELELVNDKGEEIAIFPVSQFISAPGRSRNSAYKNFVLDVTDTLTKEDKPETRGSGHTPPSLSWQRAGSKRSYAIKMTDGEPTPENSEQALYLAYLYLGAHQPEKAWQMLDVCDKKFGGITGTFAEVEYLQWIIEGLPFVKKSATPASASSSAKELIESTPEVVSCQLKALSFLARLDPHSISPGVTIDKPKTQNEQISNDRTKEVRKFVEQSRKHIATLYERLLDFREANEMLVQYALTTEEQWMLLDYCQMKDTLRPRASLEYQKHYVGMLTHELNNLSKITKPSAVIIKKIKTIKAYIDNVNPILFATQAVGEEKLTLTRIPSRAKEALYTDSRLDNLLTDSLFNPLSSAPKQIEAMEALSDEMSDEKILQFFSLYVTIAEDKKSPYFERIKTFSERALLSYAKASSNVISGSRVYLLANVLYRICQNDNTDFLVKAKRAYSTALRIWEYENKRPSADHERRKREWAKKSLIEELVSTAEDLMVEPIDIRSMLTQAPTSISVEAIQAMLPESKPDKKAVPLEHTVSLVHEFRTFIKTH